MLPWRRGSAPSETSTSASTTSVTSRLGSGTAAAAAAAAADGTDAPAAVAAAGARRRGGEGRAGGGGGGGAGGAKGTRGGGTLARSNSSSSDTTTSGFRRASADRLPDPSRHNEGAPAWMRADLAVDRVRVDWAHYHRFRELGAKLRRVWCSNRTVLGPFSVFLSTLIMWNKKTWFALDTYPGALSLAIEHWFFEAISYSWPTCWSKMRYFFHLARASRGRLPGSEHSLPPNAHALCQGKAAKEPREREKPERCLGMTSIFLSSCLEERATKRALLRECKGKPCLN